MITIRRIWLQVRKHCYLSLCAFVVCMGMFYLACAALLIALPHYQQQITQEFRDLLGQPIDFSRVKFAWRGFRVYARVYNVDIGEHNDKVHIDNITKIQFLLHPVKSLFQLKPVIDDITINGGKIYLNYNNQEVSSNNLNPENINDYIKQILNHAYLDWININQVNLKNTSVILGGSFEKTKDTKIEEYLISELNIYNTARYNYLYGLIYHVNKEHYKNKEREIIELALKYSNSKANIIGGNKFYLATNSKGLEYILNNVMQANKQVYLSNIDLDPNTWLKAWGNFDFTRFLQIQLDSPKIRFKETSGNTIDITNVNGIFDFDINNSSDYNIAINKLNADFAGSAFKLTGNINKQSESKPATINTYIKFGHNNLQKFFAQLPASLLGHGTSNWLKQHITKGWLGSSEIIWRGQLDNSFPYDEKYDLPHGIFQLRAEILDTNIDYMPGQWPAVEHLNGILSLRGRDLFIESTSAQISQSNVNNITASIKGLGKAKQTNLLIDSNIGTNGDDLHHIIQTSQLKKKLNGVNKNTEFKGDMDLVLNLFIPLSATQKNKVSGSLNFKQNELIVTDTPLKFTNLIGSINFTDNTVSSKNLEAKFNQRAAKFDILNKDKNFGTLITLNSWVDTQYLLDYYKLDLQNYIKGAAEFDLKLNIRNFKNNKEELSVQVATSLLGVESLLPAPYNKTLKERMPFKFHLTHDFANFTEYRVIVNENATGNISRAVLSKNKQDYSLLVDTKMAYGKLFFVKAGHKVIADFDYIKLPDNIMDEQGSLAKNKFDYFRLPDLFVTVNQLYLGRNLLGKTDFSVSPNKEQKILAINNFAMNGDALDLKLQGKYIDGQDNKQQTLVHGTYNIKDIAKTWKIFSVKKFDEKIKLKGYYNLSWDSDLLSPQLASMSGDLVVTSGHGRINDIEPGLGRVFSLLDLAAINKRLRLDFSDVFENGYKFDAVKGKFKINNGVLTTKRTTLQAGSADIELYGDVDLVHKSYNLMADVTPHLTTGLPIAAAVIGTPIAGAAVFLLDKILEYPVNQLSERAYSISGSWSDPKIKSMRSKRGSLIELSWFKPKDKN